ncbi:AlbA family DNA-binding domain-containing protein [Adhaeretor mobilis]|uniref:Divergent AAA domain protein n=1 Tax=Adhaeretor mobilis TaxID=1930276 RepID=A0A517N233_9BACT|nr:ATP-binding protein [Adhaeretor mobilis]QDT01202.1 Divergent AAA domain protein [Adhaeretor mobilis]
MSVPQWADEELSASLDSWIAEGESVSLEFKGELPDQRRKIAQEIAAMATSGGGSILMGVSDEGDVVGLPLADGGARDDYFEQIQGIVDTVRPSVAADLQYGVTQSQTILIISIPKQSDPVFYVEHRPYIRDGRRSRPARPEEVVASVWAHPSSEHKREMERIHERQMANIVDGGQRARDSYLQR